MAQKTAPLEKLTLLLDWFINPDHAPLLAADSIGAFGDMGLDVEIIQSADPSMPPHRLADKQADLALNYQPELHLLVDAGLPLVRVGTIIDTPLATVAALQSSGIRTMADFKGKRMGCAVTGVDTVTLEAMLKSSGITLSDITMVNVNFQLVKALISGEVDGVVGGYRNFEATEIREHGVEPILFNVEDFGVPLYDELIVVAHRDNVGDPRIGRFLEAVKKGTDYLLANPADSWDRFILAYPALDNNLNRTAWKDTLPLFSKDPFVLDTARYETYGQFLLANGLIGNLPPLGDYAVQLG
jgi:putative hydroxymethylpyrimidine transport system substrate-binding protein